MCLQVTNDIHMYMYILGVVAVLYLHTTNAIHVAMLLFIAGIQQCPSVEAQDPVSQEVSWVGSAVRDRCMCCVGEWSCNSLDNPYCIHEVTFGWKIFSIFVDAWVWICTRQSQELNKRHCIINVASTLNGGFHFIFCCPSCMWTVISTSVAFSLFDAIHVTDCNLSGHLLRNSHDSSRIRSDITAERVWWPGLPYGLKTHRDGVWSRHNLAATVLRRLRRRCYDRAHIKGGTTRSQTQGLWLKSLVLCHWATTHTGKPPPTSCPY